MSNWTEYDQMTARVRACVMKVKYGSYTTPLHLAQLLEDEAKKIRVKEHRKMMEANQEKLDVE